VFTKSTKVLIAALVLAGMSLAVGANASPRSTPGGWQGGGLLGVDTTPPERHDPTNTNGS
jgi:hypothetical protein